MTPEQRAEIESVIEDLEKFRMTRSAGRLRQVLAAGEAEADERPCPIQDHTGQLRAIPWGLAEILYPAYGHSQTLERLAERGGFGRGELGMLACDQYGGTRSRPRLGKMPLLTLYEAARANL